MTLEPGTCPPATLTRVAAVGGEAFQGRGDLLLPMDQRSDLRALCGEMTGDGSTEDPGGAGDDGDLTSD